MSDKARFWYLTLGILIMVTVLTDTTFVENLFLGAAIAAIGFAFFPDA